MALAQLTREVRFSAAHRYHRPDWSEERNRSTFGACANPHGHGHLYRLEVTVAGAIADDTGFCVDLGTLDAILKREIVDVLDHQHINHVVPEFAPGARVPTTESLLVWMWPRVARALPEGAQLRRMLLREDDGLYAEYFGGALP